MSKALVTFGVGPHASVLALSRPLFQAYAARHGYAYVEPQLVPASRPPSWWKVHYLAHLLQTHEQVLWLDADVVIVEGRECLAATVPPDAWQAMVIHRTHLGFDMGEVPSCGVWLVRRPMLPLLRQVWEMTGYLAHPWWEQAALHELLGYTHNGSDIFPVRHEHATALYQRTHFLDERWNSVEMRNPHADACLMHMAGLAHAERLERMREWAGRAYAKGEKIHG